MNFWKIFKKIDNRFKFILVSFITIFVSCIVGAAISELKTVVDIISWPITTFSTTIHPQNGTADFYKIIYAGLCILFYAALISFPFYCISAFRHANSENEQDEEDDLEIELYSEEIASTLEVLERSIPANNQEKEEALENFLRGISNKIGECFPGIKMSTVRYAFILSHPYTSNTEYLTVKCGRNGSLTENDHKVIDWILVNKEEDFYIDGNIKTSISSLPTGYDIETVVLVRNSGQDFRFGFVILFQDPSILQDSETVDKIIINFSAIRLFAYMDTLWNSMVQFSYTITRGGGNNESH